MQRSALNIITILKARTTGTLHYTLRHSQQHPHSGLIPMKTKEDVQKFCALLRTNCAAVPGGSRPLASQATGDSINEMARAHTYEKVARAIYQAVSETERLAAPMQHWEGPGQHIQEPGDRPGPLLCTSFFLD